MAAMTVKPAFTDNMRKTSDNSFTGRGKEVRAALPARKEATRTKSKGRVKRAMGRR